ncbi:ATP-dependent DNA helicase DinG [Marinobacterium jannaschii]|uniref:ATP-dependent DNA helicase DinG n=1 Tax=Marinobacterium jannaschii TaxID=64970 RepID=UPI0004845ACC|nr:ATP-dependent DNA helicase DinG [Marinobacterium jannaschii]
MLDNSTKARIQGAYSTFLENRKLKPRSGQKMMIAQIARTLGSIEQTGEGERDGGAHIAVVEAGTGTGKTMAYLLASVPVAQARKKKVVVATATVALQEQLILKDLPQLVADAGINLTYVLAKGRGRYFCVSKAEQVLHDQNELGQIALYEDEQERKLDADAVSFYKSLLNDFAAGEWDGDRDSLTDAVEEELWRPMTSDHLQCTNRRCANFSICPFFQARQALDGADLIVANHDLVLADLSLGGGAILPEPADAIFVFDEGHHLGAKTTGHFAYSMKLRSSQRWLSKAMRQLNKMLTDCEHHQVLSRYVEQLSQPFTDMEHMLEQWQQMFSEMFKDKMDRREARYRFAQGVLPEELMVLASSFKGSAERAAQKFEQIVDLLKQGMDGEVADISRDAAERWYPQIGQLTARMQGMCGLGRSYAAPDPAGSSPTARWVNIADSLEGVDFECRSSPVSAADTLRSNLWDVCYGAVVTSATLTALGRFDRLQADLGLPADASFGCQQSPFDYYNAAELLIPAMKSDPKEPDLHTAEVAEYLERELKEIDAGLVLFSSWKQMLTVLDNMPQSLKEHILVQGELAKHEILSRHRKQVDQDVRSIIFGLASFAEGVDLPGKYLTEVIITKLPFGVPDDPVDATMAEWIEQQGGNAFSEWAIPMASMRLTQAAGRLLRTEQDRGRVTLLDRRLVNRRYGRQLLDALPSFRRNFA